MDYYHLSSSPFLFDPSSLIFPVEQKCGSPACTIDPNETFADYDSHPPVHWPQMLQTNATQQLYEGSGFDSPLSASSTASWLTPIHTPQCHEPSIFDLDGVVHTDYYPFLDQPSSSKLPALDMYGCDGDQVYQPTLPPIHFVFPSLSQLAAQDLVSCSMSSPDPNAYFESFSPCVASPLDTVQTLPIHQPKPQRPPAPILSYSAEQLSSHSQDEPNSDEEVPMDQSTAPHPFWEDLEDSTSMQLLDFLQDPHLYDFSL